MIRATADQVESTSIAMARPPDLEMLGSPPLPVAGVRLAAAAAGLRYSDRDDIALIELCEGAVATGVFTRNHFKAAPVAVAQAHLGECPPRYLLVNAGIANAGAGEDGIADAECCCKALADLASVPTAAVLPFSTGVIGRRLPVDRVEKTLPGLLSALSDNAWGDAARAIMTTDTRPKSEGVFCALGDTVPPVTITAIAKGAGMICPDMATMLAFIATDIELVASDARKLLAETCESSFNVITVDGDTSTNDACMLLATGRSGARFSALDDEGRSAFSAALSRVMQGLAQSIVRDAEGASRFITIKVEGALDAEAARIVAMTVANSPLVKTALSTGDPNWGRILAAIGRAPVNLAIDDVDFYFGEGRDEIKVVTHGAVDPGYEEARGVAALANTDIKIRITLGKGDASVKVWTSDLTAEYVMVNANYRS